MDHSLVVRSCRVTLASRLLSLQSVQVMVPTHEIGQMPYHGSPRRLTQAMSCCLVSRSSGRDRWASGDSEFDLSVYRFCDDAHERGARTGNGIILSVRCRSVVAFEAINESASIS